jgi:hypothetical protein
MTGWLKQSTSVSVVIGPVWATADGSLKADLAYNASGINCDVYKNGTKADVTLANSAGDGYFRAASGEALYLLTLSTGHTDTLGAFTISLSATGYYMKPQHYMVVPANVWDSMFGADTLKCEVVEISGDTAAADALESYCDGTTPIPANAIQISGDATAADNCELMFDGTGYAGGTTKLAVEVNTKTGFSLANGSIAAATFAAGAVDAAALAADAGTEIGAAVKTAVEAAGSHLALIKAKTDSLTFTVAGDVDCNVQTWKGSAAADMTGDAYARLGAPAGASVSADVAAVKSDSAAILVDTGTTLPGTLSTMDGKLDTIDNFIDTEVAAILEDTGTTLPATLATIEGKIDTADAVADAIKVVTDAIGATGSGLSAVPWNAAWDAEVQSECTDALNAYDPPTNAEMEARTLAAASYFDPAADTVAHVTLVDTTTTNTDMVSAAPSAASVADAVWDEAIAGHAGAGSAGAALSSASSAGDPWSTAIPGAYGAGTAGYVLGTQGATGSGLSAVPWNASWDAEVQSECTDALNAYDPPTKAELDAADDATLAAIAALSIPTATENADALLNRDMSAVSDTTARSPLNALRQLRNKVATAEGTMTVYKEDDATEAWIAALTTDASAEAITVVDPA